MRRVYVFVASAMVSVGCAPYVASSRPALTRAGGRASPVEQVRAPSAPPLRCPPAAASLLDSPQSPSWEVDPLGHWPRCLETRDGARVRIERDTTDADGWRESLVVEDAAGERFRVPTRAASAMGLAADGSVVLAHTEQRVSLISPVGRVVWSTAHPRCGAPAVAVGYAGEVVLACGYSLLKFSPDGRFLWQKWPFGNVHVSRPFLSRDGSMIVSGAGTVAWLDTDGETRRTLSAGPNRYVHLIGAQANGNLIFRTSMAERHSDGPVHFYYEYEPPELFVVTREGATVARAPAESPPPGGWPTSLPWTPDLRSGRLP
jgi:hypothetical protein